MRPPSPPDRPRFRESAAVVLVRGSGASLEVFWVRRGDAVGYMPGFHAFIGGKVDAGDLQLLMSGADALPELERAMRACAIREAFEETGVLIALEFPADPAPLDAARIQLLAEEEAFHDLAKANRWRFRADALSFAGRWTTPAFASQRFDTMFFLARVPQDQQASIIPGELASGEWIRPADALARWERGAACFAAPILHILHALAGPEDGLFARLTGAPEAAAQPIRRIEMQWGVVLQPMRTRPLPPATHTNAYLIGEHEMALVDPGSGAPEEVEALERMIGTLEHEGRRLTAIVITHHHPDHIGGLDALRARHEVPVMAHADTARHVKVDAVLRDGDWIPLLPGANGEWALQVIHTPGHTRGSICLYQPRIRALFTGDHIPGGTGTVIIDPPEGDMRAYLDSLRRLESLEIETLYPAHGSPQGGAQRRIRGLIQHRLEREARVLASLRPEPLSIEQLVPIAYADTPPELWSYAQRSLLAHLEKLASEGKARRDGANWAKA